MINTIKKEIISIIFPLFLCSCFFSGSSSDVKAGLSINTVKVSPQVFTENTTSLIFNWEVDLYPVQTYTLEVYLSLNNSLDSEDIFLFSFTTQNSTGTLEFSNETLVFQKIKNSPPGTYNIIFKLIPSGSTNYVTRSFYPFKKKGKWTVAIYMDGDNSLDSYTYYDLSELKEVGSSTDVGVVAQVDRLSEPAKRIFIKKDEEVLLQNLGEVNMGDPDTLLNFLKWTADNFPADHYLIVLWNHGGGFKRLLTGVTKNICTDETSRDSITIPELRNVFNEFYQYLGRKVDIVGMDTCLMAMLEVAHALKNSTAIMVASENTEPGEGWPYDRILNYLVQNSDTSPQDLAKNIVSSFINTYTIYDTATLSALDLSKLDDLEKNVNQLADALISKIENDPTGSNKTTILTTIYNNVQRFDDQNEYYITTSDSYADLYDLCSLIGEDFPDLKLIANQVMQEVNATVLLSGNTGGSVSRAHGISIWFPDLTTFSEYQNLYFSLSFSQNSTWDDFLKTLYE